MTPKVATTSMAQKLLAVIYCVAILEPVMHPREVHAKHYGVKAKTSEIGEAMQPGGVQPRRPAKEEMQKKGTQPKFMSPPHNVTTPRGRDATLVCSVEHLGGYRVGWVKATSKAIQAIHDHVITHNPRVSVSSSHHQIWYLHMKSVQLDDEGPYICQINTDPMISQTIYLEVTMSPDFISELTSGDTSVTEGGNLTLACKASGRPDPKIMWRREDNRDIIIKENGLTTPVRIYEGEMLKLVKVSRSEMGVYLCIASNGVTPTVSKRVNVDVHFHPVIHVPNQLVGAPLGTDVALECYVEAFPKSICFWVVDGGEMLISSYKYEIRQFDKSDYQFRIVLVVKNMEQDDIGTYKCVVKNFAGEVDSSIRLYEIPGPAKEDRAPPDEEDYSDQFGSAEQGQYDDETSNDANRAPGTQAKSRGNISSKRGNHVPKDLESSASFCAIPFFLPAAIILNRI